MSLASPIPASLALPRHRSAIAPAAAATWRPFGRSATAATAPPARRQRADHALRSRCDRRVPRPVFAADPSVVMAVEAEVTRGTTTTALAVVAEAFEGLAGELEGGDGELRLGPFSEACSHVSALFGALGVAFKFAEKEYVSKVNSLLEASKTYDTLCSLLDDDAKNDTIRKQGSHSRNLRRVRLGLDLIKALFEQFLLSNVCSLRDAASTAYAQVCAPYHPWALRTAVGAGMYALPTREELLLRLNENGFRSSNSECSIEPVACGQRSKEEGTSQIEEATSFLLSDRQEQVTTGHRSLCLEQDDACLSLGHAGNLLSSGNQGCGDPAEHNKDVDKPCFFVNQDKENVPHITSSKELGVDLSAVDVSNTVEYNPFYPYRKLGQAKPADASECGSTTGPLEESEPLRMWKKMKQNGFFSLSHGGIPLPKQRDRQPRKRKEDELKKKTELPKRPQVSTCAKVVAPSGLLSGLDPGIIKHVRNSKQVHSIIEAMVRSENHDRQNQNKFNGQLARGGKKETNNTSKSQSCAFDLAPKEALERPSFPLSSGRGKTNELDIADKSFHNEMYTTSQSASEFDNDTLALKLSSVVTMGSDDSKSASGDDLSAKQQSMTSLSFKAASVASQWLELLQLDIKGRLAALRRSKKRVRNVIQTELPYLLSTEFSLNLENDSCSRCSTSEMHVAQWKSLFGNMDKALFEEAKRLENWLREIQEMRLHCDKGLKYVDALSQTSSSDISRHAMQPDERECAIMAAAASIYSTCNLIMTKENMPCF